MPEVYFEVRLPDGEALRCYSPSLIVTELLAADTPYPVFEFRARARAALEIAAERVRLKYGFSCSAAMDQLSQLEERLRDAPAQAIVHVLKFSR